MAAPAVVADAAQKGPYEIGFTSFVLTDSSRPGDGAAYLHRPLPVYVWYPADAQAVTPAWPQALYPMDPLYAGLPSFPADAWAPYGFDQALQEPAPSADGPFPLVVISPGWGGSAWQHMPIATRLASHGFVVAVPYHAGDQFWPWEPLFDRLSVATFNRPRDVSFVLTDLLAKNAMAGHLLHGTMRPDQVAAAGWSLGGYASIVLASGDEALATRWPTSIPIRRRGPACRRRRIRESRRSSPSTVPGGFCGFRS
jgi:predicted dienelactone hydrolase